MVQFIDAHRDAYGVESICTVVPIAPSTYFWHKARHADPTRRSARVQRDDGWRREIQRVWDDNQQVYGPRKVWRQLRRDGHRVARCTVGRLMRAMGLRGAVRGRAWVTTTQADGGADRPVDLVDRHFVATRPNQLWVSDFTYVATYLTYPAAHRQFCWAHVRRNLLSAQDLATTAAARRFCREALTLQRQLCRLWHRFRGDPRTRGAPLTRAQLVAKVLPIEKCLFALAERDVNAPDVKVSNLARALFVHHAHVFTFVHEEAVAPTNNVAERALRTAVQWRKIMFGNRSAEGERAVARLLTVTRTCQLQQLHVLAYLTAAIHSHRRRQPVASLLPKRLTP